MKITAYKYSGFQILEPGTLFCAVYHLVIGSSTFVSISLRW